MTLTLNVALLGYGRISSKHVEAIEAHPRLSLWGVCDSDPEKLQGLSARGIRTFSSSEEMLEEQANIHMASVLTYSNDHPDHAAEFLRAGIPTLIEKPLALSTSKAVMIRNLSASSGVPAFVVKQNRLNQAVQAIIRALENGHFGELLFVSAKVYWCRPESYYRDGSWRMRRDLDGGVVWNQASHYVDLIQLLLGRIVTVQAFGANFLSPADSQDTVFSHFVSESGALGSLEATTTIRPKNFEGSLLIAGTKGIVKIGGHALNKIEHWGLEENQPEGLGEVKPSDSRDVYGHSHQGVYESVVRHVEGLESSEFVVMDALHTIEIMEAIDLSIENKRAVTVTEGLRVER